jgi:hypothetical protein
VTTKGWIFSARGDFLFFGAPVFICLWTIALLQKPADIRSSLAWLLIGKLLCDFGHLFPTFLLVFTNSSRWMKRLRWVPLILLLFIYIWLAYSATTFFVFAAYATLFHVVRQQYGWLTLSRRHANEEDGDLNKLFDVTMLYNVTVFPILLWHAGFSQVPLQYFLPNDMPFRIPEAYVPVLLVCHWALNLTYLLYQIFRRIKNKPASYGKYLILGSTWCWFYLGLFFASAFWQFWFMTTLIHGLSYHAHTFKVIFSPLRKEQNYKFLIGYASCIALFSYLYYQGSEVAMSNGKGQMVLTVLWTVSLSHILYDSIIWRSNSMKIGLTTKLPLRESHI